MKLLNRCFIIFTIIWAIIIFLFSMENGQDSSKNSGYIVGLIENIFIKDFHSYDEVKQQQINEIIGFWVRKTAHFLEFAILGFGIYMSLLTRSLMNKKLIEIWKKFWLRFCIYTQIFVSIYAITDELHQGMVDGRQPALRDVLIDSAGGLWMIVTITAIVWIVYHRKINRL